MGRINKVLTQSWLSHLYLLTVQCKEFEHLPCVPSDFSPSWKLHLSLLSLGIPILKILVFEAIRNASKGIKPADAFTYLRVK